MQYWSRSAFSAAAVVTVEAADWGCLTVWPETATTVDKRAIDPATESFLFMSTPQGNAKK